MRVRSWSSQQWQGADCIADLHDDPHEIRTCTLTICSQSETSIMGTQFFAPPSHHNNVDWETSQSHHGTVKSTSNHYVMLKTCKSPARNSSDLLWCTIWHYLSLSISSIHGHGITMTLWMATSKPLWIYSNRKASYRLPLYETNLIFQNIS